MSLATRCPTCHTVFRVVQDQLKVSGGWVRCGRCNEVFNALEGLFDLAPDPVAIRHAAVACPEAPDDDSPIELIFDEPQLPLGTMATDAPPAPSAAVDEIELPAAPSQAPNDTPPLGATPDFLRLAARPGRWEQPRAVVALALLCALLALALGIQAAVHFRDLLTTAAPPLRPALEALCDAMACRIEPLRRIDAIAVEGSSLRASAQGKAVQLSVVLRNRAAVAVATPWVELTLTDIDGRMLVRRVLPPSDFGVTQPMLAAASETALQAVLSTGDLAVSGYTIEPFYP